MSSAYQCKFVISAIVIVVVTGSGVFAEEAPDVKRREQRQSLRFSDTGKLDVFVPSRSEFSEYMISVGEATAIKTGEKSTVMQIIHTTRIPRGTKRFTEDAAVIHYPLLERKEIVPIAGDLYRVERFGGGGISAEPADLSLLPEEAPEPPWENYTVPIGGMITMNNWQADVTAIERSEEGENAWSVDIKVDGLHRMPNGSLLSIQQTLDNVTVGKEFDVGLPYNYRLEHIVPPDPKDKVIGWIEFKPLFEQGPPPLGSGEGSTASQANEMDE